MPDSMAHLTELTLEQLVDGDLGPDERREALSHTSECIRCTAELEFYQALFGALATMPRFAPSPEFGDAVIARLRVAPGTNPALARLRRWLPKTRRGWSTLAVALATPVVGVIALIAWLFSHPLISPAYLGRWAAGAALGAAQSTGTALLGMGNESALARLAGSVYSLLLGIPPGLFIVAAVVLAVGIPLSVWSLVRLVRTPMGDVTYAN